MSWPDLQARLEINVGPEACGAIHLLLQLRDRLLLHEVELLQHGHEDGVVLALTLFSDSLSGFRL
jgi:hypothetical protein